MAQVANNSDSHPYICTFVHQFFWYSVCDSDRTIMHMDNGSSETNAKQTLCRYSMKEAILLTIP